MHRKSEEMAFQAAHAVEIAVLRTGPSNIPRYRPNRCWRLYRSECLYRALGNLQGKLSLDFGCGEGIDSAIYAALGAKVTGVDVSRN